MVDANSQYAVYIIYLMYTACDVIIHVPYTQEITLRIRHIPNKDLPYI